MTSSLYTLYLVMMFPVVAVAVFLIHDWWKHTKEAHHGKSHKPNESSPRAFLR